MTPEASPVGGGVDAARDLGMPVAHVVDRHGYAWRLVRDDGMATRAHYSGIVSIGIAELDRQSGPLRPLEPLLARLEAAEAALGRVRALHENNSGPNDWCVGCHDSHAHETWPCPTRAALAGAGDTP